MVKKAFFVKNPRPSRMAQVIYMGSRKLFLACERLYIGDHIHNVLVFKSYTILAKSCHMRTFPSITHR